MAQALIRPGSTPGTQYWKEKIGSYKLSSDLMHTIMHMHAHTQNKHFYKVSWKDAQVRWILLLRRLKWKE